VKRDKMAVSKDDLLINLELEAKGFRTELKKTAKDLEESDRQSKQLEKAVKELEKTFSAVQSQVRSTDKELVKNQKIMQDTAGLYRDTAGAVNELTEAYKSVESTLKSVAESFRLLAEVGNDFFSLLDRLTDPEFIIRLSRLILILSALARIKGFDALSSNLKDLSGRLDEAAVFFSRFREDGNLALSSLAERAKLIHDIKNALDFTGNIAILLTTVGIITGLNDVLLDFGFVTKSVSKPLSKLPNLVRSVTLPIEQLFGAIDQAIGAGRRLAKSFAEVATGAKDVNTFILLTEERLKSIKDASKAFGQALGDLAKISSSVVRDVAAKITKGLNLVPLFVTAARDAITAFNREVVRMVLITNEPYVAYEKVAQTLGQRFQRSLKSFFSSEFTKTLDEASEGLITSLKSISIASASVANSIINNLSKAADRVGNSILRMIGSSKNFKVIFDQVPIAIKQYSLLSASLSSLLSGLGSALTSFGSSAEGVFGKLSATVLDSFRLIAKMTARISASILSQSRTVLSLLPVLDFMLTPLVALQNPIAKLVSGINGFNNSIQLSTKVGKNVFSTFNLMGKAVNEFTGPVEFAAQIFMMNISSMGVAVSILNSTIADMLLALAGLPPIFKIINLTVFTTALLSVGEVGIIARNNLKNFGTFLVFLAGQVKQSFINLADNILEFPSALREVWKSQAIVSKSTISTGASFASLSSLAKNLGKNLFDLSRTFLTIAGASLAAPFEIAAKEISGFISSVVRASSFLTNLKLNIIALSSVFAPTVEEMVGGLKDFGSILSKMGSFAPTFFDDILFGIKNIKNAGSLKDLGKILSFSFGGAFTLAKNVSAMGMEEILQVVKARGTVLAGIFKSTGILISEQWAGTIDNLIISVASSEVGIVGAFDKTFKALSRSVKVFANGFAVGFAAPLVTAGSMFSSFGSSLKSTLPSLLTLTEISSVAGPALLGVGVAAARSENDLVKFGGIAAVIAGTAMVGLTSAMLFFMDVVGKFIASVGDKLINAMTAFEQKFQKAQVVTKAFEFTVRNFGDTLGTEVIGTLEMWNKTVDDMVATTQFGFQEVQRAIQLLIAESQIVSLSLSQSQMLLARASDIAAAKQLDLAGVIDSLIAGMTGQSQSVRALGINLTEAHLEHSTFTESLIKQGVEITENSKQLIRFNEIMKQSAPIAGFAAQAVDTVAGANLMYGKALDRVEITLGSQSNFTVAYIKTLTEIAETFASMPKGILDFVGIAIDAGGVTLKLIGTLLQYGLVISSLSTLYSVLNKVITGSVFVQSQLTMASSFAAASLGVQTVAVTSLSAAMKNALILIGGSFAKALTSLGTVLLTLTANVAKFTAAILLNPVFIKGMVLVGVVFALIEAYKQLSDTLKDVSESAKSAGEETSAVGEALTGLMDFLKRGFQGAVNVFKLILLGLLKIVEVTKISISGFKALAARLPGLKNLVEPIDDIKKGFFDSIEQLSKLDIEVENIIGGGTAMAASFSDAAGSLNKLAEAGKDFSKSIKLDKSITSSLEIDILGTEVDKAKKKFEELNQSLNSLRDSGIIKVGTEFLMPTEENLKKLSEGMLNKGADKAVRVPATAAQLNDAAIELQKQSLELTKVRRDSLIEVNKLEREGSLKILEENGKIIEAIKRRGQVALDEIVKQRLEQEKIAPLTAKEAAEFEKLIAVMKKSTAIEVAAKQKEILSGFNELLKTVTDENTKLAQELAGVADASLLGVDMRLAAQLSILDAKLKEFNETGKYNAEQKSALEEQISLQQKLLKVIADRSKRELISARELSRLQKEADSSKGKEAAAGVNRFLGGESKTVEVAGPPAPGQDAPTQLLPPSALSSLAGSVSGFMAAADAIADFVQKLIDFVPNFINKIAKIFDSLADLPNKLVESVGNLIKGMKNFISNFLSNITKSVGDTVRMIIDELFSGIFDSLAEMGENLADSWIAEIEKFPESIGKMIENAINFGIFRMVNRLMATFPRIWKALIKAMPALIKAIGKGFSDGFKGLINEMLRAFGRKKLFNISTDGLDKSMDNLGKKVGKSSDQLFKVMDLEAEAKAAKLATILNPERIGKSIWEAIKKAFMQAHKFFMDLGSMIWMGFFQPVVDWFKRKGKEIWDGFVEPVMNWFGDRGTEVWNGFLKPVGEWFGEMGTKIWKGFLQPVGEWFGEAGTKLWTGFVNGMGSFRDAIGGVLTKVGNAFSDALNSLPGKLQGAFDALKPANLMEKVFKIDYKGKGNIEDKVLKMDVPWSNFALGGIVKGAQKVMGDSKLNDIVPAILSPGEAVIPKSLMGNPNVNAMIEGILSGKITNLEDMAELIMGPLKEGLSSLMSTPVQFNQGGIVGAPKMAMASGMSGGSTSISNNFHFNITLDIDASATSLDATFVRNKLIPDIKKELKDSSLRGEFLLSNRGLR